MTGKPRSIRAAGTASHTVRSSMLSVRRGQGGGGTPGAAGPLCCQPRTCTCHNPPAPGRTHRAPPPPPLLHNLPQALCRDSAPLHIGPFYPFCLYRALSLPNPPPPPLGDSLAT